MKPSQVKHLVKLAHSIRQPLFIWGPPGVGKSAIVKQAAAELDIDLMDVRATLLDPVDLRGVPITDPEKQQAIWLPPSFLPRDGRGVLFLDELNSAPPLVQAACYQLVLDRRVGEYVLPEGWTVVAAGNHEGEGITHRMPAPLANRFAHLEFEVDLEEWVAWALSNGIEDEVIAFIRFRPNLLFQFDPTHYREKAFPTPRTWEKVSRFLTALKRSQNGTHLTYEVARGCVGEGPAAEFTAFLNVYRQIPSFEEILLNPDATPVPEEPSALYAIATMVASRVRKDSFPTVVRYLDRMPEEFQVLAVKDALQHPEAKEIAHTRSFTEWASRHSSLLV